MIYSEKDICNSSLSIIPFCHWLFLQYFHFVDIIKFIHNEALEKNMKETIPLSFSCSYFSYKNGSLTREKIRDEISLSAISEKWPQVEIKEKQEDKATWDVFNQLLDITPRGNFGNIGKKMFY